MLPDHVTRYPDLYAGALLDVAVASAHYRAIRGQEPEAAADAWKNVVRALDALYATRPRPAGPKVDVL